MGMERSEGERRPGRRPEEMGDGTGGSAAGSVQMRGERRVGRA